MRDERSRARMREAMRVLSVWKAMAMMSHIRRVVAEVFWQAVGGALHREERLALVAGAVLGLTLVHPHPFDPLLHVADAGQVLVELGLVAGADLSAELRGAVLDAVEDTQVAEAAAVFEEAVEGEGRV